MDTRQSWSSELRRQAPDPELGEALCNALAAFLDSDLELLRVDANERAITHRLALHLQTYFPGWHVDCEYNRSGSLPKRLVGVARREGTTEGSRVYPDIVVHRRTVPLNLLVIEVKKSRGSKAHDILKIAFYQGELGYRYGLFVRFGTHERAGVSEVQWVPDGGDDVQSPGRAEWDGRPR